MITAPVLPRERLSGALLRILALLGACVFINYIDRGNLSIAAPLLKDELQITPARLGVLLSAFFWTYALLQPVYGWLVDRFNAYWLLGACFALWSLATAVTGLVHAFTILFAVRLIVGVGESVSYPAFSKIIALNFPEQRRGLANSIVAAGLFLGPGFGMLLGGTLMARFGWRPFFIGLGLISLLWLPLWFKWTPHSNFVPSTRASVGPTLLEFLCLRSAWGSSIGLFSCNYVNYFFLTWMPYYLVREQHRSRDDMAKLGAAAYLVSAVCSSASGWLSDRWIVAGGSPTFVRKLFAGGALAVCGILMLFIPVTSPKVSAFFLLACLAFFGASGSNLFAISQRLAGPQAAGRWVGLQNGIGNLAGVVVPVVTGVAVTRTGHFYTASAVTTIVSLIGSASWIFLIGKIEQVNWGDDNTER